MATFVFIHGAGGRGSYWDLVAAEVRVAGHHAVAMDLPCDDDAAGWSEYADAVVEAIGDRRGDLVLVAQSLGGFTAPLVAERVPVELIVLVTAMVPRPGETGDEWWANTGTAEAIAAQGLPEDADLFVHDVAEDVLAAAGEPRDQSATPMGQPFRSTAGRTCPHGSCSAWRTASSRPAGCERWSGPPRGRTGRGPRRPLRVPQPAPTAGCGHPPFVGRANVPGSGLIPTGIVPAMADERGETPVDIKPRSRDVTDGPTRAGGRAMLRAVGMTDDDWDKPQVAVASSWNKVTPCNMPLARLAKRSKDGIRAAGGFPIEFTTIAVSDGISMGHEGMRASLVSREIIADSVEAVMHAERLDALVTFAGCDKSLPGMLMAAARVNLPSVFLYGGSILPGRHRGQDISIVEVFEAVGAHAAGTIDDAELDAIERSAASRAPPAGDG